MPRRRRAGEIGTLALGAALLGCGSSPCTVPGRLSVVGNATDCGTLDLTVGTSDSVQEAQAAQTCVLDAIGSGSAFKIVWTSEDETGPTTEAYSNDGPMTPFYHYLSQGTFGAAASPNVRQWTCGSIAVTAGCTVSGGSFCLSCTTETEEVQLCGTES